VRPEGVVNAIPFMEQGAKGEIPKRGALLLRANADGSYSIRDGNSTFTIAQAAGWSEMPSKIITDAQYATELSRKAADRILNQDALGKNKLRTVIEEDLGKTETKVFVNALKDRQTFKNANEVFAAAVPNHDALNLATKQAAEKLGIRFTAAPVKTIDGINKKAIKYGGDYFKVADAARTGINAASMKEADDFVKAMEKQFHLLDEGWKVTPEGYFDRKIMVIFDDKTLGEIQIWPPGMLNAKQEPTLHAKNGHKYYKIAYDPKTAPDVAADAKQKMVEIYGAVTSKLDPSFATKLGIGAPSPSNVVSTSLDGISLEPSSVSTARASSSEPPDGFQTADLDDQIIPSDPSIAATSPKSNSINLTAIDDDPFFTSNIGDLRANIKSDLLDEQFPVGFTEDPEGQPIARTVTARQLFNEIAQEDAMVERLSRCPI